MLELLATLEAKARRDDGSAGVAIDRIVSSREHGMPRVQARFVLDDLVAAGYVLRTGWQHQLTERGRRTIGQWPSDDLVRELALVLQAQLASAKDDAERSRIRRLIDAVTDVGTGTMANVLAAVVSQQLGMR